jgi:hypothetical protein
MRSFYRFGDSECVNSGWRADFAPAVQAGIELADYFTPPFELRATPGEPIPTGATVDGLDPTDRLVVFDSTRKKVAPKDAFVAVTGSGITVPLALLNDGFAYFQSTDCTGPLFINGDGDTLVRPPIFVGPRDTVYVRTEEPVRQRMYSRRGNNGECGELRFVSGGGHVTLGLFSDYAPGAPIGIDLADYFTPPFTVRAGRGTRPLPTP